MADINNINVNGTTYNIVDDEAMRLASNPTNNNILVTNANGQAVDSGVSISGIGGSGTTIYDDTIAYDELTFETVGSGADTVKVGIDMELLWTNSSPTSTFSAQTVSLDLSDYALVYIVCLMSTSYQTQYITSHLFKVGSGLSYRMFGGGSTIMFRDATPTTSGVEFSVGYIVTTYASNTTDNARIVPLHIYGIR